MGTHSGSSTVFTRRKATVIAVPSAVALIVAGAFVAAPALAAAPSTPLPFPTVCGSASPSASSPSASASSAASPSTTATGTPSPSATPTGTATKPVPLLGPGASKTPTSSASPSAPSPSPSSSSGGFWGWLNGVWTWIFGDAQYVGNHAAVAAAAPMNGGIHAHFEAAAAGVTPTSAPSTAPSTGPSCIPSAEASALAAKAAANGTSEGVYAGTVPWVMKTPSMLMYSLTYNGIKTVQVWDASTKSYTAEKVLDFTTSKITIQSMVTYSIQNGQTVYNNAGNGTTTTLINTHLMVVSLQADLLGFIAQTYNVNNPPPLPVGLTVPLIPVLFTNVTTQIAFLNTGTIGVPGFDGFAKNGVVSPP